MMLDFTPAQDIESFALIDESVPWERNLVQTTNNLNQSTILFFEQFLKFHNLNRSSLSIHTPHWEKVLWNVKENGLPSLHSYNIKKIDETNTLDISCVLDEKDKGVMEGYLECRHFDKNVYMQKNNVSLEMMVLVNEILKKFGIDTSLYVDKKHIHNISPY